MRSYRTSATLGLVLLIVRRAFSRPQKPNNSDNLEAQATWKEVYTSDLLSPDLAIADTLEATCPSVLISTCIVGLEGELESALAA